MKHVIGRVLRWLLPPRPLFEAEREARAAAFNAAYEAWRAQAVTPGGAEGGAGRGRPPAGAGG
jgi:hypothetical protein